MAKKSSAAGGARPKSRGSLHHRTVIGREQRTRTRSYIIEVAITVFAEQGPFRPVIDDFVRAAGVSRGTFYNYFSTVHDLLEAAVNTVTNDYIEQIEPIVADIDNPVLRFACASRLFQQRTRVDPVFAAFVAAVAGVASRIDVQLHSDIDEAISKGLVSVQSSDAAFIAGAGMGQYAVLFRNSRRDRADVPDTEIVRMVLMAWGVSKPLIVKALAMPLPPISYRPLQARVPAR